MEHGTRLSSVPARKVHGLCTGARTSITQRLQGSWPKGRPGAGRPRNALRYLGVQQAVELLEQLTEKCADKRFKSDGSSVKNETLCASMKSRYWEQCLCFTHIPDAETQLVTTTNLEFGQRVTEREKETQDCWLARKVPAPNWARVAAQMNSSAIAQHCNLYGRERVSDRNVGGVPTYPPEKSAQCGQFFVISFSLHTTTYEPRSVTVCSCIARSCRLHCRPMRALLSVVSVRNDTATVTTAALIGVR